MMKKSMTVFVGRAAFCAAVVALLGCGEEDLGEIQNELPIAVAGDDLTAPAGQRVSFSSAASSDPDGEIARAEWDFGDETENAVGEAVEHIFTAEGFYTVTLTVTDDLGGKASDDLLINITENEAPVIIIDAPLASIVGDSVRFDASASYDPDGTISSFTWDLGDGLQRFGPIIDVTFDQAGTVFAELTVVDDVGTEVVAVHEILITERPSSFTGTWNWFLTDDSLRDLGFPCGEFHDSTLNIVEDAPSIAITELAGGVEVEYTGILQDDGHFEVQNSFLGATQTIVGEFTSPTTFVGTYSFDPGLGETCPDRPVEGLKVGE